MPNRTVRVTPKGNQWQVKTDGATRAVKLTGTKKEAVEIAKEIAKNQRAELVTHGKDGKIMSKDSFGNDPNPPKDLEH